MRLVPPAASLPIPASTRRAVFIDKDGTLVDDVPYNVEPALLRFTPYAVEGLRLLAEAGFRLIVISNQPGLALGHFDLAALRRLGHALTGRLAAEGVPLSGMHVCPHLPSADGIQGPACACRKPAPGLLLEAAEAHRIDLAASWMIGDILDDVEAGQRAGCRTIHLDVGNETVWRRSPLRCPTLAVKDLLAAARAIVAASPPVVDSEPRHSAASEALAR